MYTCMQMSMEAKKRASGSLELEFQVILSCQDGCWDLNSGSFLEVLGLRTTEYLPSPIAVFGMQV